MVKALARLVWLTLALAVAPLAAQAKTFFWISHGSPADPVWTYFLAGAEMWAKDTGQTVKTSFHNGDVPSQQEAIRTAIAAKADGIVTTSPDPGSLVDVVKEARAAGIPVINFNTPDSKVDFNAYVGGDLLVVGKAWAQYLVDHQLVKSGDFVWMPVEVPGASYGVEEEKGIASVFKPLNITWEVTDATLDQATVISRMSDYLTANHAKIKAIIGLGDMVTGSIKRVFDPGRPQGWRNPGRRLGQLPRYDGRGLERLRQCRDVAGPAGDELSCALARGYGVRGRSSGLQHHGRQSLRQEQCRRVRQDDVGQQVDGSIRPPARESSRPGARPSSSS